MHTLTNIEYQKELRVGRRILHLQQKHIIKDSKIALWTWSGMNWSKCPWHAEDKGNLKAVIYGSGESLKEVDKFPKGYMRIVQNKAVSEVEPHIWIGMDEPEADFGRELMESPFRKVFRGNYAGMLVDGIPAKEYPETYFIDVKPQNKSVVFGNRGLDCSFYWNKNTMQVTIHLALWMGFKTIAFAGVDLGGSYFDKRKLSKKRKANTDRLLKQQFEWMKWFVKACKRAGITLENMSENSRLKEIIL